MKLVTVSQMQAIEKEADAGGLTYDQMMENAGQGLADIILSLYAGDGEAEAVGLVGPGNNGGDTLVRCPRLPRKAGRRAPILSNARKTIWSNAFSKPVERSSSGKTLRAAGGSNRDCRRFSGRHLWHGDQAAVEERCCEFLSEVNDVLDGLDEPPLIIAVIVPQAWIVIPARRRRKPSPRT